MTNQKMTLRPGINRQASQTANEGGYYDASRVRFRFGTPQKIGGWIKWMSPLLSGVCRAIHAWSQINTLVDVAFGTNDHVYLVQGGTVYDVTPVRAATVAVNAGNIATTNGIATVAVTSAVAHGLTAGDWFTFDTISGTSRTPSGITVATISLTGDFKVAAVSSTTAFTFVAGSTANASTTYGSPATITEYLAAGLASTVAGTGWGAGGYGGAQGGGVTTGWGIAAPAGTTLLPARIWSLDNWGEYMLAVPSQGNLYSWQPSGTGTVTTRLAVVTNGGTPGYGPPLVIGQGFVAMPERHYIMLGASSLNSASNYDPLLVRWSDKEDYTTYFALTTNTAGSARLQGGSAIIGAYNTQAQTLIWTDTMVYTMRFIGAPYVYRFDALGQNCGLIGTNAHAALGGVVYWMSNNAFFMFNGGQPQVMPCTLWDDVFSTLTFSQQIKVYCSTVAAFGEVTWFYPANGSVEPNRYVTYNTIEQCWYGGAMDRGAFLDAGILSTPIGTNASGQVYAHESGVDADGSAMGEYLVSGFMDIGDGEDMMFVRSFIPDFQYLSGAITLTLNSTLYPNATPRQRGPYTVTNTSTNINARTRGRQISFRLDGGGVGSNWRLGATRFDVQPDGSR